jgi:hypothetical protein
VRLVGEKSNRSAIGARIRVTLPRAEAGSAIRFREVTSGGSFGASSLAQHIGIGSATSIAELEIRWPSSGRVQRFRNVPINSYVEIRELADRFVVRQVPRIVLGGR